MKLTVHSYANAQPGLPLYTRGKDLGKKKQALAQAYSILSKIFPRKSPSLVKKRPQQNSRLVKFALPSLLSPVLCGLMVACASTTTPPPTPVEVKVPLPVPCKVNVVAPPAFAVDALPLGAGIWAQMLALRAERLQRKGYEAVLATAIKACQ